MKEGAIRAACKEEVERITLSMEHVKSVNKMMAANVGKMEHTVADTQKAYTETCAQLAKEKLLRRHREHQTEQAKKEVLSEKSKKHMHTLVYKQQIVILKEAVAKERAERLMLEHNAKDSHNEMHKLKNMIAKTKLLERLKKKRQESVDAEPVFDLDVTALKDSPVMNGGWVTNEVASDLQFVAASSDNLEQSRQLLQQIKYVSLCETVDDLESELDDLHRVKQLKQKGIDNIEANVDAASMLAESKEHELRAEVEELTTDLKESDTEVMKLRQEVEEANTTIREWQEYYEENMKDKDKKESFDEPNDLEGSMNIDALEGSMMNIDAVEANDSDSFEESVAEDAADDQKDRLSDVD